MARREKVTSGQVAELTTWVRRLTPREYQARRSLLRRATDPKRELGSKLLYPFKDERPLEWGWTLVREGAPCERKIVIGKLELVPFHKDGEDSVSGDEMLRRARDVKNFPGCADWSQHHAEQLFGRASELPKEWVRSDGPVLLFPDTEFRDDIGSRLIPYLIWRGGEWQQGWSYLGIDFFFRHCLFLRLGK